MSNITMTNLKPISVNIQWTIDYEDLATSPFFHSRASRTKRLKRFVVVEAFGIKPKAAAWFPLTDAEIEREYNALQDNNCVEVLHDGILFHTGADSKATFRLHDRLCSSKDNTPG